MQAAHKDFYGSTPDVRRILNFMNGRSEKSDPRAVSARLIELREALGKNRVDFAASLGMSPQRLYNWENGQELSKEGALRIAAVHGVSLDWLFLGIERSGMDPEVRDKLHAYRKEKAAQERRSA
jgi:transcriptional regulator with XRE-family HTH domain